MRQFKVHGLVFHDLQGAQQVVFAVTLLKISIKREIISPVMSYASHGKLHYRHFSNARDSNSRPQRLKVRPGEGAAVGIAFIQW
jgi:hypothetical protein